MSFFYIKLEAFHNKHHSNIRWFKKINGQNIYLDDLQVLGKNCDISKGRYTYHVHENRPIFKTTHPPPCLATSKIFPPLDLGPPVSNESPLPLQIITNQLKENVIQGLLHVIRSFHQVGFCSQYQLINLVWLFIDSYTFNWSQPRPKSYFEKLKTSFSPSSYSEKMCWVKFELKPY